MDYCDVEWFPLEMNRDHSVVFEIASKYCISGASLVAQRLKRLPGMRETWVQSLGQEDLLEKGMATHSSILAATTSAKKKSGSKKYLGASLVAQRLKHLPAMWETRVRSLGQEEPLEEGNGNPLQ